MKKLAMAAAIAAVVGAAALPLQSQAWGGPWGGWGPWGNSGYGGGPWSGLGDMFGDVDANFSSRGWGRGSGYGYPYYGGYYGPYGYPGYGVPYYAPPVVAAPVDPAREPRLAADAVGADLTAPGVAVGVAALNGEFGHVGLIGHGGGVLQPLSGRRGL